jgi:pantoate--beta-alanine ligase
MKICTLKEELAAELDAYRLKKRTIGFVPTMGALHEGHLSLVKRSKSENDLTVVSIFVNPTQFNNAQDLKNYPRTIEADMKMLSGAEVDFVFEPSVNEMYDTNDSDFKNSTTDKEEYRFGELETVMEGKFRPGHFKGVAQIVRRLLDLTKPNKAYFGEKDFQQLAVIRKLVKDYHLPVEIIACPTLREPSGLAMSSRNMRLTPELHSEAAVISTALHWMKYSGRSYSPKEATRHAVAMIESSGSLKVEYLEVADSETLQPINQWNITGTLRAFAAVQAGEVRLIDNVSLSPSAE